jgi:NAD dependent epimerase/dehydratase
MKRALVTGADGFIGSHLVEALLTAGYHVKALAYYNSYNFYGWLEDIPPHPELEIVTGDVRDPHFCGHLCRNTDIIFHLAALIAIPFSYYSPDLYLETNVRGTLNILQAARDNGGIRVIHTSTSEVYGTAQYVPIDENHPKQPQSPYSASKIAADAMALSFYNTFNLPVTIARPFNTYGPRQSARAIIPTIISQIAAGIKVIKTGDLSPTRDFNYVEDTCQGFLALAESNDTIGKEINISSNYEISMLEILKMVKDVMKAEVKFELDEVRLRPKNSEVFRLWGDNRLIQQLTGFHPVINIQEGLELTCKWFQDPNNLSKYKPTTYNL